MSTTGDFRPEHLERRRYPISDEHAPVPDCSSCSRFEDLLVYLDTGEGPFEMTEHRRNNLHTIMTRAAHDSAMASVMISAGICPFGMLMDRVFDGHSFPAMPLGDVLQKVPLGSCPRFDEQYRPPQDAHLR